MSWLGDAISTVCGGISTACGAVSSFCGKVADCVGTAMSKISGVAETCATAFGILSKLALIIPGCQPAAGVLGTIAKVTSVVAVVAGIFKAGETTQDIGERALQAEEQGITLDSCDGDFEKYGNSTPL